MRRGLEECADGAAARGEGVAAALPASGRAVGIRVRSVQCLPPLPFGQPRGQRLPGCLRPRVTHFGAPL